MNPNRETMMRDEVGGLFCFGKRTMQDEQSINRIRKNERENPDVFSIY